MKTLQHIFSSEFIEAIGWTIVHSLWQGVVVALVLSLLLLLMKKNSAQLKYLISFFALLIVLGWSGVTFTQSYRYALEKSALKENIRSNPDYIKTLLTEKLVANAALETEKDQAVNLKLLEVRSFFLRNFNLICFLWLVGMAFLIVRMAGGLLYTKRLKTHRVISLGDEWIKKVDTFARELNIKRKVNAFFSPLAQVPMTLGTLKPVILFPISAFTGLSPKAIEAIIAHELAHIVRHDYFFNIVQSLVEIIFFYHPAVWLVSANIRNERENSCDNIAIELTGDRVAYVKALASIEINKAEEGQLAMAFASPKGNILNRIKRLQKQVAMKTNFIEGLIAAGVVVIGLTLVSFTMNRGVHSQVLPDDSATQFTIQEGEAVKKSPENSTVWTVEKVDSLKKELETNIQRSEKLDKVSDDMKKMVEVAMSEEDEAVSAEMMAEINAALEELDVEGIVQEALWEAKVALEEVDFEEINREIRAEFDSEEFRREMEDAKREMRDARRELDEARREVREEMRRDMEDDDVPEEIIEFSIQAAEAGIGAAEAVLENLPLDEILEAAFEGVGAAFEALGEIDFEEMMEEINEDLQDDFSEEEMEELIEQIREEKEHRRELMEEEREARQERLEEERERMREELEEQRELMKEQREVQYEQQMEIMERERKAMKEQLEKEREAMQQQLEAERAAMKEELEKEKERIKKEQKEQKKEKRKNKKKDKDD